MAGFVTSIESLNIFKSPTSEFGLEVSVKEISFILTKKKSHNNIIYLRKWSEKFKKSRPKNAIKSNQYFSIRIKILLSELMENIPNKIQ